MPNSVQGPGRLVPIDVAPPAEDRQGVSSGLVGIALATVPDRDQRRQWLCIDDKEMRLVRECFNCHCPTPCADPAERSCHIATLDSARLPGSMKCQISPDCYRERDLKLRDYNVGGIWVRALIAGLACVVETQFHSTIAGNILAIGGSAIAIRGMFTGMNGFRSAEWRDTRRFR